MFGEGMAIEQAVCVGVCVCVCVCACKHVRVHVYVCVDVHGGVCTHLGCVVWKESKVRSPEAFFKAIHSLCGNSESVSSAVKWEQ